MEIKQLIEAIESGDASTINALFDKVMAGKLAEAIESKKQEIAQGLFEDTETVIEDYDLDEIEAFMQTEEFEQLDELSKSTLGNYVKKASSDMAMTHAMKVKKDSESDEVDRFTNRHMNNSFKDRDEIKRMLGATQKERNDLHRKTSKRSVGIKRAVDRLTKESIESFMQTEEFEQLDELSKNALSRYVMRNHEKSMELARHKAENDDAQSKAMSLDYGSNREASKHMAPVRDALHREGKKISNKISRRQFGMYRAARNLSK